VLAQEFDVDREAVDAAIAARQAAPDLDTGEPRKLG
jgi:hypothetical protein